MIDQSQRERRLAQDTYDKIFATFGFEHLDGTDKASELRVVKIIMIRESLLSTLHYLSDKALKTNSINGTQLLQLLSQVRDSTLNYLEALILWRQSYLSPSNNQPEQQLQFVWEGRNYTLKLLHDLDFLSENSLVCEALSLRPEQLFLNPLMLANNLDDPDTYMDPAQRAQLDCEGDTSGQGFEGRLRLRYAERILLQERE
ncbi:hypothetical protein EON64_02160, partial [archaeon]